MTIPKDQSPAANDEPSLPDLSRSDVPDDDQVKGGVILYNGHAGLGANVAAPSPKATTGPT